MTTHTELFMLTPGPSLSDFLCFGGSGQGFFQEGGVGGRDGSLSSGLPGIRRPLSESHSSLMAGLHYQVQDTLSLPQPGTSKEAAIWEKGWLKAPTLEPTTSLKKPPTVPWACFLICKMRKQDHMTLESLPALNHRMVLFNPKWEMEATRPKCPDTPALYLPFFIPSPTCP